MKRDRSIVQADMSKCFICGTTHGLHTHEIFFGTANRKKSIKHGLYVRLCGPHHNLSNAGVHFNKALDLSIKKIGQKKFEERYDRLEFINTFGKSYLND